MITRYWHFLPADRRLRYGDNRLVEAGRTYDADGPLVLCKNGMHASLRALDALHWAPGPIICCVTLAGGMLEDIDKVCARSRTVLWIADATTTLHEFAVWCAEEALLKEQCAGREPDPRSWKALEVKRAWLRGEASDDDMTAARDAARAAWDAARVAAWDAARVAARAARDAARVAASAAWDAAWAAARAAQDRELSRRLLLLAPPEFAGEGDHNPTGDTQ